MTDFPLIRRSAACIATVACVAVPGLAPLAVHAQTQPQPRAQTPAPASPGSLNGDYIVAVVNEELVTAGEVERRVEQMQVQAQVAAAQRSDARLPLESQFRQQALDALIQDRVIVTHAREASGRIDDVDLDRAMQSIAQQNQLTMDQLRERMRTEGIDFARFRGDLRDQMMVERVREREVYQRITITDLEIDRWVDQQRAQAQADADLNIAQILVTVPADADAAVRQARRARAEAALARVRGGEDFATVARELSEDGNRERGGEIGLRAAQRLPDLFVEAVRPLASGQIASGLVESGAGYHVLKLIERHDGAALRVTQTHARHILLRTSQQLSTEAASRRVAEMRRQIEAGLRTFDDLARRFSDDGSAASGGDLGWAGSGQFVPEFEDAMSRLSIGGLSPPVASRFGVHLIQVLDRREVALDAKQLREQARQALREQKFAQAYAEWATDLRARAYVELRDPPL